MMCGKVNYEWIISNVGLLSRSVSPPRYHRSNPLYLILIDPVTSITMSKDSTTLLVSSLNSCIRAMDATTGNLFQKFTGHKNESFRSKACFAGGGEGTVVFGDEDGVVRAWELESVSILSDVGSPH